MGLVLAGYSLAGTAVPALIGPIAGRWGWRVGMGVVSAVLTMVGLPLTYFFLLDKDEDEEEEEAEPWGGDADPEGVPSPVHTATRAETPAGAAIPPALLLPSSVGSLPGGGAPATMESALPLGHAAALQLPTIAESAAAAPFSSPDAVGEVEGATEAAPPSPPPANAAPPPPPSSLPPTRL